MPSHLSLTDAQVFVALRSFLLAILPEGVEVVRGQVNRVAPPRSPNYVVMTPLLRERLSTNIDSYQDLTAPGQSEAAASASAALQDLPPGAIVQGVANFLQPVRLTVQLDLYGPESGDNAQRVTTLFRDESACQFFAETGQDVQPLYTSEPRQLPFVNAEQQVEMRETVEVILQANPVVTLPQQFADALNVVLVQVP